MFVSTFFFKEGRKVFFLQERNNDVVYSTYDTEGQNNCDGDSE